MPQRLVSSLFFILVIMVAIPVMAQSVIGGTIVGGSDINCVDGCDIDIDADGLYEVKIESTGLLVGMHETGLGVTLYGITSDPCDPQREGMLFWNDTDNQLCVCNGNHGGGVRTTDMATSCF